VKYAICVALLALTAFAQETKPPKPAPLTFFGGYSFMHFDTQGAGFQANAHGFQGAVEYNFVPFFGVEASLSGNYESFGIAKAQSYTYLIGPHLSVTSGRTTLFAHGLVGRNTLSAAVFGASANDHAFAAALGGGLDVHFNRMVGWRVFELDYLPTSHDTGRGLQKNARASAGFLFSF
jgi:hypothetical protein